MNATSTTYRVNPFAMMNQGSSAPSVKVYFRTARWKWCNQGCATVGKEKNEANISSEFPQTTCNFCNDSSDHFCIFPRRILYYMYHVIYPCIMMSTLTLLVFCLPPDSGEKIALGITVLLAFSVLMLSIAEKLPETSESVPVISE